MTDSAYSKLLRETLATFLKTHRDRLQPEDVGLERGTRRRTPGLRRDEVASLAGVSVAWYTWLEQARDIRLSRAAALRLARALRFGEIETAHLLALTDGKTLAPAVADSSCISAAVRSVIDAQGIHPAYVLNQRWDALAWNYACEALMGTFGSEQFGESNVLRYMFLDPSARVAIVDWAQHARRMAAQFRQTSVQLGGHPLFATLIADLRAESAEFEACWRSHEVLAQTVGIKRFEHPVMGPLAFHHAAFQVNEHPGLRLVIYVGLDGQSNLAMRKALESSKEPTR